MKCFNYFEVDAVGSCEPCCKELCAQCANDNGVGIVCSSTCESQGAIHAMVERNRRVFDFAPRTHSRQAFFLALMAGLFIGFGIDSVVCFQQQKDCQALHFQSDLAPRILGCARWNEMAPAWGRLKEGDHRKPFQLYTRAQPVYTVRQSEY